MVRNVVPSSLMDIEEIFGLGVVLKLMQHFGGRDLQFPKYPKDNHEMVALLGYEVTQSLCNHMSGDRMYIPHGRCNMKMKEVARLKDAGMSRAQIARLIGISERHVSRIANKDPPDELPLFRNST